MEQITLSEITVFPVAQEKAGGQSYLIGWANCVINDSLRLSGIALHLSLPDGKFIINFPAKRAGGGYRFFFQPTSAKVAEDFRVALEKEARRAGLLGPI